MKKLIFIIAIITLSIHNYSQYQIIYNSGAKDILNFCSFYNNHDSNTNVYLLQNGDTVTSAPPSWLRYYRNSNQWLNSPHTQFHAGGTCYTGTGGYYWSWMKNFIRSKNDTNYMVGYYCWVSCFPVESGYYSKITYNNGQSARTIDTGFSSYDIDPLNDSLIYGLGGAYLMPTQYWKSTNKGVSWNPISLPFSIYNTSGIVKVNPLKRNEVFLINHDTIYKSTNFGNNFSFLSNIQSVSGAFSFDLADSSIYYTNSNSNLAIAGIYKSTNHGSNWTQVLSNLRCFLLLINSDNHNIVYCTASDGLYRSTNSGINWSKYFNNLSPSLNVIGLVKYENDGDTIFAATSRNIYKIWGQNVISTDTLHIFGTIYYQDNNQPVSCGYVKALYLDKNTAQIITVDSTGIQSNGTYSLSHVPQDSIYIMAYDDDETRPMYVPTYYPSTTNWQNATVLYPTGNLTNINVLVYRVNLSLGIMHIGGGVFSTSTTLTGLNNAIVYAKIGNQYKGYAISGSTGSYRIDSLSSGSYTVICDRLGYAGDNKNISLSNFNQDTVNFYLQKIVSINKEGSPVPTTYKLFQNYPNPFNPVTTIKFNIPNINPPLAKGGQGGLTSLKIYDILGREVATLVNENLAPGTYEVHWDGSNYSSGVYFYKLTSGDFTETKKLVLLK